MTKIQVPQSTFPVIENISQMKDVLKAHPELRVIDSGKGTLTVAYNISDKNTFKDPIACEARGITFDEETGNTIGRPLHKFFNLGEREDTLKQNVDFSNVFAIWDKMDGSMISFHRAKGEVLPKTKKSFESNEAKRAYQYVLKSGNQNIIAFCDELADEFTPVFEFLDPENTIVVSHKKMDMVLLHVRHIKTGAYIPFNDKCLTELVEKHGIKRLIPLTLKQKENGVLDIDAALEHLKVAQGIEGYILQFTNGKMIKIKSDWYNAQHRAEAGLRERDVAKMFLEGTLDDVKGSLKTDGYDITRIEEIESRILDTLNEMESYVVKRVKELQGLDFKTAALQVKSDNNPLGNYVLNTLRGKELRLDKHFKAYCLNSYSLEYLDLQKMEDQS